MATRPRLRATPVSAGAASVSPRSGGPPGDEAIWKRLAEAGLDEETVRRRDKAALITYITKLESEVYDYQHHMGLLIMEKKEWACKYEQIKTSAESAELAYKRDQAAQLSALAEAKKREENLKRALGIEKECLVTMEKALHDMRAESAERKLQYESKMAEAYLMMETAQKKLNEAEGKLRAAESINAEASRSRDSALRNIQDVEAREDELRRQLISFKSDCDAKEKEINLQKKSLYESQKILHDEEERFEERQKLLNQREEYNLERLKELGLFEKKLEEAKAKFEQECRAQKEEKLNLDLNRIALATREESLIQRESLLDKKERELLILQERIANKEYDKIQKQMKDHQSALERRNEEFEAEIEQRRMSFEEEMNMKIAALTDRETELNRREEMIMKRDKDFELQLSALAEKQDDVMKKLKLLEEKESDLQSAQTTVQLQMRDLQKEREGITKMKADLEKARNSVEVEKKEFLHVQEKLELTASERSELLVLETKLKEEVDSFRAQKLELELEGDKLKAEKEKFEAEWELIDEKREELRMEAERIAEEREAVSKYLKNEHDSIKQEKEVLRSQFKNNSESLAREREEFMSKMEREHSDWFNKIQQEREDFLKDIKIQRRELENCIDKKREEIEGNLKQREEAFEQERAKELHHINSQKETIAKELEHVASELKRLNNERMEITLDRERREREWSEIKESVEMLNIQREKLQKQRELLHADREAINQQIHYLKNLEDLNLESENRALSEMQSYQVNSGRWKVPVKKCSNTLSLGKSMKDSDEKEVPANGNSTPRLLPEKGSGSISPSTSATFSWIRKCAGIIFNHSPGKIVYGNDERNVECKISTNFVGVPVGKETTPNSNFRENINFEDGERVTISKLGRLQDPSVLTGGMGLKEQDRIGRKKETQSARSALVDSNAMTVVPVMDKNAKGLPSMEVTNSTENSGQPKEDVAPDMNGRRPTNVGSGDKSFVLGKKRLNDSLSPDHADVHLVPSRKHQKTMRQKENEVEEEAISKCVLSTQLVYSDDVCGLLSFNQNIEGKDVSQGGMDKEHEILVVSHLKPPEALQNAMLYANIPENGRPHGSESSTHVGTGISSASSHENGIVKTQENVTKVSAEAEEPSKQHNVCAVELAADDCSKPSEQDEYNQDSDSEDNKEDEERMSIKEKL